MDKREKIKERTEPIEDYVSLKNLSNKSKNSSFLKRRSKKIIRKYDEK